MNQDELKRAVARAAITEIEAEFDQGAILGVGTGSTADLFIDELASCKHRFAAAVASSERSAARLRGHGIEVVDLNTVERLPVYVDGADEVTPAMAMLKGGGGALTREKIVAAASRRFVCIADGSKLVSTLGHFPLPIEVIPMARALLMRQLGTLGGEVRWRLSVDGRPYVTDNGNFILDVHGLSIADPCALEQELNGLVGLVTSGLFALRGADVLLLGTEQGLKVMRKVDG